MPRPPIERQIGQTAPVTYFKPQGIPLRMLKTVTLAEDELEAIRLTDFDGLYQEQAAEQMGVSRQTLGLIVKRAHQKVAEALTQGKAICVEGGPEAQHIAPPSPRKNGGCGPGRGRGRCPGNRARHGFPNENS